VLYLILCLTSVFGLIYVPSRIIVDGDISATIGNIQRFEMLFRMGIVSNLIYLTVFVFLIFAFYEIFKPFNERRAAVMRALVLVAVPIAFLNELNRGSVLLMLKDISGTAPSGMAGLQDKIRLALETYKMGGSMVMLFWGLWMVPLGLLFMESGLAPRFLGVLLLVGAAGYVMAFFLLLLNPAVGNAVFVYVTLPSALSELITIFWLLSGCITVGTAIKKGGVA
jgi:hypothetical protein